MPSNNWYVITGGPSTGKTTLLADLEELGYAVIPEAARIIINSALGQGISVAERRKDEKLFQEDVARLKAQIESTHPKDTVTFLDRGMHDTLAYLESYGFAVEQWVEELLTTSRYQRVFLLEPLATYEQDYARTESPEFVDKIHRLLHNAYAKYGMQPIRVPAMSRSARVQFILNAINPRNN